MKGVDACISMIYSKQVDLTKYRKRLLVVDFLKQFRLTAKLRGRFRDFPNSPYPTLASPPPLSTPQ